MGPCHQCRYGRGPVSQRVVPKSANFRSVASTMGELYSKIRKCRISPSKTAGVRPLLHHCGHEPVPLDVNRLHRASSDTMAAD